MTIQEKARLWPANAVELWPIDDLLPYARNSRTHSDEQVEPLVAPIAQSDWTKPFLVLIGNRFSLSREWDHDRTLAIFDHRPNGIKRARDRQRCAACLEIRGDNARCLDGAFYCFLGRGAAAVGSDEIGNANAPSGSRSI